MQEDQTFRSRLIELMKRSRQAVRLYGSVGKIRGDLNSEYGEIQAIEWKNANNELLRLLLAALDNPNQRELGQEVGIIHQRFAKDSQNINEQLQSKQSKLLNAAQNGDFVRSAVLSAELVSLKAKLQASQAACHELHEVLKRSKLSVAPIELGAEELVSEPRMAKVIPLRALPKRVQVG